MFFDPLNYVTRKTKRKEIETDILYRNFFIFFSFFKFCSVCLYGFNGNCIDGSLKISDLTRRGKSILSHKHFKYLTQNIYIQNSEYIRLNDVLTVFKNDGIVYRSNFFENMCN